MNDTSNIILKDKGLCNCFTTEKTRLRIKNLEKKNYNITLGYDWYERSSRIGNYTKALKEKIHVLILSIIEGLTP